MTSLEALVARVPEGWTAVSYAGRRWGLTRSTHVEGRSVSVYAEELGGPEIVSANVFRLSGGDELRPCEMPASTVLDFLEGWERRSVTDLPQIGRSWVVSAQSVTSSPHIGPVDDGDGHQPQFGTVRVCASGQSGSRVRSPEPRACGPA